MITVAELKGLAANKSLSIGEAWNAIAAAAERIEDMENWLRPIVERMRLEAHVHRNSDAFHAETLEAFAKDVEASFANHWDEAKGSYVEGWPTSYVKARRSVGESNCPGEKGGKCRCDTHDHRR